MKKLQRTPEEFHKRTYPEPNTGCWIWAGAAIGKRGYGYFSNDNGSKLAHRFSYEIHKGQIGDKHVCHKCDNPWCVNPDHLFLGTHKENMLDMKAKDRVYRNRGPKNKNTKLTEDQVLKIRELHDPKVFPTRALAKKFNVCQKTVMEILHREIWNYI